MATGYLAFVLHAHLPFVRHPEHKRHLEERWFYEALIECYLPLLDAFDRMADDGVSFALSMSVTPPLAAIVQPAYAAPWVPPGHDVVVIDNGPPDAPTVTFAVDVAEPDSLVAVRV